MMIEDIIRGESKRAEFKETPYRKYAMLNNATKNTFKKVYMNDIKKAKYVLPHYAPQDLYAMDHDGIVWAYCLLQDRFDAFAAVLEP